MLLLNMLFQMLCNKYIKGCTGCVLRAGKVCKILLVMTLQRKFRETGNASPNITKVTKSRRMVGACITHGIHDKCIQCFPWKI